jgi:hypothetical protein
MVFFKVILLFSVCIIDELYCRSCKRLREFEEIEISSQSLEATVNS